MSSAMELIEFATLPTFKKTLCVTEKRRQIENPYLLTVFSAVPSLLPP